MIHNSKIKIAVALSGGVDSAVAAKRLKDEGYQLVGFFLKLWSDPKCSIKGENRCCDYEALEDARRVAAKLDIQFYVIDAKDEFKKEVVDYFIEEYKSLRTPNPCVVCNEKIKFDLLLKKALEIGCDKLATGHYARVVSVNPNNKIRMTNKNSSHNDQKSKLIAKNLQPTPKGPLIPGATYNLFSGLDPSKDQSYNLYRLNQDQLAHIIFPLGEMTKKEVRSLAVKWNLPVKEKPESQEICFFGDGNYRDFLRRYLPDKYFKAGDIVDTAGNVIGQHEGLVNYTIGQRKGVDQAQISNLKSHINNSKLKSSLCHSEFVSESQRSRNKFGMTNKKPLYVLGFDVQKNQLIVGENEDVFQKSMTASDLHWIDPDSTRYSLLATNLNVKIRSQAKVVECRIKNTELRIKPNTISVVFDEPQRAITPGQSAVFYVGDEVIGGGIISSSS